MYAQFANQPITRPLLVIIGGLPGTGKSTLGSFLSQELSFPCVSKDGIKETLYDTLGYSDRKWSRKLGVASFELLYYFIGLELAAGHVDSQILDEVSTLITGPQSKPLPPQCPLITLDTTDLALVDYSGVVKTIRAIQRANN